MDEYPSYVQVYFGSIAKTGYRSVLQRKLGKKEGEGVIGVVQAQKEEVRSKGSGVVIQEVREKMISSDVELEGKGSIVS